MMNTIPVFKDIALVIDNEVLQSGKVVSVIDKARSLGNLRFIKVFGACTDEEIYRSTTARNGCKFKHIQDGSRLSMGIEVAEMMHDPLYRPNIVCVVSEQRNLDSMADYLKGYNAEMIQWA